MLNPPGIGVPDWPPPFRFGHPDSASHARTFEPFIAAHFTDEEAWDALFTDEHRLRVFKVIHGNRRSKRRRQR